MTEQSSDQKYNFDAAILTEQSWTPENQLSEMRAWRCTRDDRFARFKIPEKYWDAEDHLIQIHRISQNADPDNPGPQDPSRLLFNFIKYLEDTRRDDDVDLNFYFLSDFYDYYLEDVKFFNDAGFKKSYNTALYHSADSLRDLQALYADHDFILQDDIKKAFDLNIKNPGLHLQNLERTVSDFKDNFEPGVRQEYNFTTGSWSTSFIKYILIHRSDPYAVARNILSTAADLRGKYIYAKDPTLEVWGKWLVTNMNSSKAQAVEQLLDDIPTGLDPGEESLSKVQTELENLRLALPEGLADNSNPKTIEVQRLAMTFNLNWHRSFEGLNLLEEARRLYYTAARYNKTLNDRQSHLQISTDLKHLYSIFRLFASEVEILRQEGPKRAAAYVGRFHPPGVYEKYKQTYQDHHPLLTDGIIVDLITRSPANVDKAIENWIIRADELSARVGAIATPGLVRRAAHYTDGLDRMRACIEFMPVAQKDYPWVARSDVERFFTNNSQPEKAFEEWVLKVEEITRRYPEDYRFNIATVKKISFKPGAVDTIVVDYITKIDALLDMYGDNPMVTKTFVVWWASNTPTSYRKAAEAYLSRVERISRMFAGFGQEIEPDALRSMAFHELNPEAKFDFSSLRTF